MPANKSLHLLIWNAQGITTITKQIELREVLKRHQVDLILISETFLNANHNFELPNYIIYRADRLTHAGGVAIGVRDYIKHQLAPPTTTKHIENIAVETIMNGHKIRITSAYSPKYSADFAADIRRMTTPDRKFIVAGDLNAKHTNWNAGLDNRAGKALAQLQAKNNFVIHHGDAPTHFPRSGNTPSNIDFLLSNCPFVFDVRILEGELHSDHAPVLYKIEAEPAHLPETHAFRYKDADWKAYRRNVRNALNNDFGNANLTPSNIESTIEHLQHILKEARDATVPRLRKASVEPDNLSRETKETIRLRNNLNRQWQRCNDFTQRTNIKTYINKLNADIKSRIASDVNTRWNKNLKNIEKGSKQFWRLMKKLKGP